MRLLVFLVAAALALGPAPALAQSTVKSVTAAARAGDAGAMNNLGVMYAHGEGVAKNEAEAVRWYRAAAAKGVPEAMFNLGTKYASGQGVAQDDAEALLWYRAAADKGHAGAIAELKRRGLTP